MIGPRVQRKEAPVAHVVSATVEGLAGRKDTLRLDLDRHINIIWGLNGSGKSTLLKILHSALSDDARRLEELPFTSASVEMYSETHDVTFKRSLTRAPRAVERQRVVRGKQGRIYYRNVEPGASSDDELQWSTEPARPSNRAIRGLFHSYLSINRVIEENPGYRYNNVSPYRDRIDESLLDELFAQQVNQRWQTYHGESLSRVRDIQQQGLGQVLSVLFGGARSAEPSSVALDDADEAYEMTRGFLRSQGMRVTFNRASFTERLRHGSELQEIVGHIRTVMRKSDDALRPQRAFQDLVRSLYAENKTVTFDARGIRISVDDTEIPLPALSSGERQLLQILLVSLSGGSSSVIIDEPELSLHVDWQERLVESMRVLNSECQLILATHSPEVMAHVPDQFIKQI